MKLWTKAFDYLFRGGTTKRPSVTPRISIPTDSGISVNELSALQSTVVFACLRLISTNVGSLPLNVYRRTVDGRERAINHPAYSLLHDSPNSNMTALEWRQLITAQMLMYGNSFSFVERFNNKPIAIWPLRPDRMKITFDENGALVYEYGSGSDKRVFKQTDILHFRVFTLDGIEGLSPISYARNAIGLSLQTERFGSSLYKNGARPSGMLRHPGSLSAEAAKRLSESFTAQYSGTDNVGKLILLEDGLEYSATSLNPEDAQFLQTRKFQAIEICRTFGVPPHLVQEIDKPTYASVDAQKEEFLSFTIRPYLTAIEQTVNKTLFADSDFYAKFTTADFIRADIEKRYKAYSIGITNSFLSPNEVRRLEELNDREGGDLFMSPLNHRVGTEEQPSA